MIFDACFLSLLPLCNIIKVNAVENSIIYNFSTAHKIAVERFGFLTTWPLKMLRTSVGLCEIIELMCCLKISQHVYLSVIGVCSYAVVNVHKSF